MNTEEVWQEFVGPLSPETFLRRMGTRDPAAALSVHMTRLPAVFGIALRGSWAETFVQQEPVTRSFVYYRLLAHLNESRELWEPQVQDLPERPVLQAVVHEPAPLQDEAPLPALEREPEDMPDHLTPPDFPVNTAVDIEGSVECESLNGEEQPASEKPEAPALGMEDSGDQDWLRP